MKNLFHIIAVLITSILFFSCSRILVEKNSQLAIYFCGKNNCADIFSKYIDNANKSIHCSLYNINLEDAKKKLAEKSSAIDVRVVINGRNYKNQLAGENVRLTKRNNHNKFCIIDGKIILTGSFNPTSSDNRSFNNIVVFLSDYLSENYEKEFREHWNALKDSKNENSAFILGNKKVTNLFCPDDYCKKNVLNVLKDAEESIYFMTYSFTDEDIADILLSKKIHIAGVFDDTQATNKYSQYERLKGFGLDVYTDNSKATMHHKVFIIDRKIVITGSMNPTNNGFFQNDENVLIIEDEETAQKFLQEFSRIYNAAREEEQ